MHLKSNLNIVNFFAKYSTLKFQMPSLGRSGSTDYPTAPRPRQPLPEPDTDLIEVKEFVDGLKSRISSEIGLLLALTDDGNDGIGGSESNERLRRYFAGTNSKLRKFIPLPLIQGGRF